MPRHLLGLRARGGLRSLASLVPAVGAMGVLQKRCKNTNVGVDVDRVDRQTPVVGFARLAYTLMVASEG